MMRILPFFVLVTGLLFSACRSEPEEPLRSEAEAKFERAKALLEAGQFRPAQATFWEIVDPENGLEPQWCEARYGHSLAVLFEVVGSLMNAGDWDGDDNGNVLGGDSFSPLSSGSSEVAATEELDGYIISFLDPVIDGYVRPVTSQLSAVVEDGCEFRTDAGIPLETANRTSIRIGRVFGTAEARLAIAVGQILEGALNYLSAHDLRLDWAATLDVVNELLYKEGEPAIARAIAIAAERGDTFLNFHPDRKQRLVQAAPKLVEGLETLRTTLDAVFAGTNSSEARDRVLAYADSNGNGRVDTGDDLWLGIVAADPNVELLGQRISRYPVNLATGDAGPLIGSVFFGYVDDEVLATLDDLLARVQANLLGRGPLLNPAEFNRLLPVDLIPDAFALDLARLMPTRLDDARPARNFLPAWGHYNPPGGDGEFLGKGYTAFLIETELAAGAPVSEYEQEVSTNSVTDFCFVCGPGERFLSSVYGKAAGHFTMATEPAAILGTDDVGGIPDDCLDPEEDESHGYGWYQDPTLNGALYINVAGLEEKACPADAGSTGPRWGSKPVAKDHAIPANQYSFNKALVWLIGGIPDVTGMF